MDSQDGDTRRGRSGDAPGPGLEPLDAETAATLKRFAFDAAVFSSLRARLIAGELGADRGRVQGQVEPPAPGDVTSFPDPGTPARARLRERGLAALRAGEVGVVILAGGMATRFGEVVKAAVEVTGGQGFLALKLADAQSLASQLGVTIPALVMTSFATHDAVRELARGLELPDVSARVFPQAVSLRLTPDGELVREGGRPSLYAPGHGDMSFALRRTGALADFLAGGGRTLLMSNVDNLAATLDPAIIGAHLEGGAAITVEVVDKHPGDRGGAPARVDGALRLVEAFAFPERFDQDRIPLFNTNTLCFDARALDRDFALTWYAVRKRAGGREVVQFERLVGELTAHLRSTYLRVERDGPEARFLPVKSPAELARREPAIARLLRARAPALLSS